MISYRAFILRFLPELASIGTLQIEKAIAGSYGIQLITQEKQRFQKVILEAIGGRERAAEILGLPRSTFFRKAKELGFVRTRRQPSLDFNSPSKY